MRRAFNFAFDFEEMNKQIFFGQYKRIDSYFEGTELASRGLPEGEELAILETVRDKVPPEVFTTPYTNPVGGSPESGRATICARRSRLLREAGYEIRNQQAGQRQDRRAVHRRVPDRPSRTASASCCSTSRRWSGSASRSRVRTVDDAQYENRLRQWDFDIDRRDAGASRCRPATSSAASGARRPPTSPARAISSASRIRRSTR